MDCVSTVSFSILINGEAKGNVQPTRGLRQGDPISPYLFLICAEGLSSMIQNAHNINLISGMTINSHCPSISHLLFADDSMVFFRANTNECAWIKFILLDYEAASCQSVNFSKSTMCVSSNVLMDCKLYLEQIL